MMDESDSPALASPPGLTSTWKENGHVVGSSPVSGGGGGDPLGATGSGQRAAGSRQQTAIDRRSRFLPFDGTPPRFPPRGCLAGGRLSRA